MLAQCKEQGSREGNNNYYRLTVANRCPANERIVEAFTETKSKLLLSNPRNNSNRSSTTELYNRDLTLSGYKKFIRVLCRYN